MTGAPAVTVVTVATASTPTGTQPTAVTVVRRLSARSPSSNVATSDIVGRVDARLLPVAHAGILPGFARYARTAAATATP